MKIVFIGTVDFSYHCLSEVLRNGGDVIGVVTSKETKYNSDYRDLTPISDQFNIPIHYCADVNAVETIEWIRAKKPDIIFCWGWSSIIKSELLSLASMGVVGAHPALLPKNRGRHPIIWALVLGLKKSGLTFFFMDEGIDSGPILSQKTFEITSIDTASMLYEKVKKLASLQIAEFMPKLVARNYKTTVQNVAEANYLRKRSVADGMIDWRMSCEAILNLIRALAEPYPGAQITYKGEMFTIWGAHKYDNDIPINIEPGKIILLENNRPIIKCYDGAIVIDRCEPCANLVKGGYI